MTEEVKKVCDILRKGGVILYPTDTIWGIGCDATNREAVKKIYSIKQRIDSKSMLVLIDSADYLDYYVEEVPEIAHSLIELSEKPITIIYPQAKNVAPDLIASDGSLGIRITKEKFSNSLCKLFKKPIVSTSANISRQLAPCFFDEISQEIKNAVDYVVEYRRNDKTKTQASSIVKLGKGNVIKVIRE